MKFMKTIKAVNTGLKAVTAMALVPVSVACSAIGGITMITAVGTAKLAEALGNSVVTDITKTES